MLRAFHLLRFCYFRIFVAAAQASGGKAVCNGSIELCLPAPLFYNATMSKKKKKPHDNTIAQNKKARHDYKIDQRFEAGIVLEGWEVKSLRAGRAQVFCRRCPRVRRSVPGQTLASHYVTMFRIGCILTVTVSRQVRKHFLK